MSCGVSRRHGSDLPLLWLWRRPAARALIRPSCLGTSTCHRCGPRKYIKKKKKKVTWYKFSNPAPPFFPKMILVLLGPLPSRINFKIQLSISLLIKAMGFFFSCFWLPLSIWSSWARDQIQAVAPVATYDPYSTVPSQGSDLLPSAFQRHWFHGTTVGTPLQDFNLGGIECINHLKIIVIFTLLGLLIHEYGIYLHLDPL